MSPLVAVTPGTVATIEIRRPSRANAYNREVLDALRDAVDTLWDQATLVVVRTQGDRVFCGGADLKELGSAAPESALDLRSQRTFNHLARAPFVSIAAIQGPAVAGGCELALACDLRVASPRATFSLPETSLGIIPSAGGSTRLTRLVGPSVAKAVILGGAVLSAEQALQHGLVHRLVDDPRAEAHAWADVLATRDPVALRLAKAVIDSGESAGSLQLERVAEAFLYGRRESKEQP